MTPWAPSSSWSRGVVEVVAVAGEGVAAWCRGAPAPPRCWERRRRWPAPPGAFDSCSMCSILRIGTAGRRGRPGRARSSRGPWVSRVMRMAAACASCASLKSRQPGGLQVWPGNAGSPSIRILLASRTPLCGGSGRCSGPYEVQTERPCSVLLGGGSLSSGCRSSGLSSVRQLRRRELECTAGADGLICARHADGRIKGKDAHPTTAITETAPGPSGTPPPPSERRTQLRW